MLISNNYKNNQIKKDSKRKTCFNIHDRQSDVVILDWSRAKEIQNERKQI